MARWQIAAKYLRFVFCWFHTWPSHLNESQTTKKESKDSWHFCFCWTPLNLINHFSSLTNRATIFPNQTRRTFGWWVAMVTSCARCLGCHLAHFSNMVPAEIGLLCPAFPGCLFALGTSLDGAHLRGWNSSEQSGLARGCHVQFLYLI